MKSKKESVNRRGFLKGAAASAAALVATPVAKAARVEEAPPRQRPSAVVPNEAQLAADSGAPRRVEVERIVEHPGSDFMMDVLKTLNFEYITTNPGSSFQGLHESIINYAGNKPELLTCCHEESAVAMAHGYAKIEGKPIMALLHGTVGTQHGSMAIYNAYADRVPIYIVIGNHMDAAVRPAGVNWYHSAQDMGALVRDFTKWDDNPASLGAFAGSAIRAYRLMMTPPMGPVAIMIDSEMQERPMPGPRPRIPKLTIPSPPQGDMAAVQEAAKMLVAAQAPLINCQRAARTPAGMKLVTELAELLQCPVNGNGERMHIPSRHPLAGNGYQGYPTDLVLDLEVQGGGAPPARAKSISISSLDLFMKRSSELI